MKRIFRLIIIVFILGGIFWGGLAFRESPRWALYQIGQGLQQNNAEKTLAFIDLNLLAQDFEQNIIQNYEHINQDTILGSLAFEVIKNAKKDFKKSLVWHIENNPGIGINGFSLAVFCGLKTINPDYVEAYYPTRLLPNGQFRFYLKFYPDHVWRIVKINQEDGLGLLVYLMNKL